MAGFKVRPFNVKDVPSLYRMMKALAKFEGYIADFEVTEETLIEKGLGESPLFSALVADDGHRLLGYAVHYTIPFTYDLRPTTILKELFVCSNTRGLGVGQALFTAVQHEAKEIGSNRLQWLVLPDNEPAKRFYRQQGSSLDTSWEHWQLKL